MTDHGPSLPEAKQRAEIARMELHAAWAGAVDWFSPDRLKAEAAMAASEQIGEAKAAMRRSANRHPIATWSVIAAITAIFTYALRRPACVLGRAGIDTIRSLRRRFVRRKRNI